MNEKLKEAIALFEEKYPKEEIESIVNVFLNSYSIRTTDVQYYLDLDKRTVIINSSSFKTL